MQTANHADIKNLFYWTKKLLSDYSSSMISSLGAKGYCFCESYLYILTILQN